MLFETLSVAVRDRSRLGEITHAVSRYGLGMLLTRFGIAGDFAKNANNMAEVSLPKRTRLALEELGPTFVKLGQILATRGDLLPPAWIEELELLHSKAPTINFYDLRSAVEQSLGEPPESAFATFDPSPLAAASMAQVHRARTHDGREVVLKVQRPGIRPRMEADLRLIAQLAAVAEKASADARRLAPQAMVRQLAGAVLEELDFTTEGRNADRLRGDFGNDDRVLIPEIHWQWTSPTLLVMDYVDGVAPTSGERLRAAGIDPAAIAALGADMVLDMVLLNGRFHGDPHPGNLLCLPGNRIGLIDLGLIGHVSPRRRQEFVGFMQSLTGSDPAQLADVLSIWSGEAAQREVVVLAAERLIARHGGGPLNLSALVADFLPLLREQGLIMPPDLLLIFKALVTIDGVLSAIEPEFDLSRAMQAAGRRIAMARLSPDHWQPIAQALLLELAHLGDDAPRLLRAAVRRLEAEPAKLAAVPDIMSAARWLSGAVFASGTLIALALIAH